MKRNYKRGITLIEMLIVMALIGLIAGIVALNVFKKYGEQLPKKAKADISTFSEALGLYHVDTGAFPGTEQGLQALRVKPEGVDQWAGPYIKADIPLDPWGHPYLYKYPGEHGDEPDIMSLGADGQPGGEGLNADIVSWK